MDRVHTWGALEQVASADLNTIQDNATGLLQLDGLWVSKPIVSCYDGASINLTGGGNIILGNKMKVNQGGSLNATGVAGGTWYYIYAYDDGTNKINFERSTTAPDNYLMYKTGDTTRRYVCAMIGTATNTVQPFYFSAGRMQYAKSSTAFISSSSSTGTATVSLVPPHVKLAIVRATLSAAGSAQILFHGGVTGTFAATGDACEGAVPTDSSQQVDWIISGGGTLIATTVGYYDQP
jgi:hypothetical protein